MTSKDQPQARHPEREPELPRPVLRLIKGNPTDEELAALITVVAAMGDAAEQKSKPPKHEWSAHHRKVRVTLPHGRGGWRSSGLPH